MENKIKLKEKAAFTLLNAGNIPVTMIVSSFLLIFYTNVVGLNPAACATLFLIARIVDAVNDPFVGFVIDRIPDTKLGHFRFTLIIGAVLCGLNYLLLWFGPLMIPAGKLAIAYISYLLLGGSLS
nr:MFS transporter [uncultured Faecalicatena sp.]